MRRAGFWLLAGALFAACESAESEGTEDRQQPIYQGTPVADVASSGVVQVNAPWGSCSGVVYSQYWVLTAAHCFNRPGHGWTGDSNNDDTVSVSEGAGLVSVSNIVNSSGTFAPPMSAWAIYKVFTPGNPFLSATWEESTGLDIALIFIQPSSTGADISKLLFTKYTSGTLNVFQGPPSDLVNKTVVAFGYGPSFPGDTSVVLRSGSKLIDLVGATTYAAEAINFAGTTCKGDSGGPDYLRIATPFIATWAVTGIHSVLLRNAGEPPSECTLRDSQGYAPAWRDWVAHNAASCPTTTRSGLCHF